MPNHANHARAVSPEAGRSAPSDHAVECTNDRHDFGPVRSLNEPRERRTSSCRGFTSIRSGNYDRPACQTNVGLSRVQTGTIGEKVNCACRRGRAKNPACTVWQPNKVLPELQLSSRPHGPTSERLRRRERGHINVRRPWWDRTASQEVRAVPNPMLNTIPSPTKPAKPIIGNIVGEVMQGVLCVKGPTKAEGNIDLVLCSKRLLQLPCDRRVSILEALESGPSRKLGTYGSLPGINQPEKELLGRHQPRIKGRYRITDCLCSGLPREARRAVMGPRSACFRRSKKVAQIAKKCGSARGNSTMPRKISELIPGLSRRRPRMAEARRCVKVARLKVTPEMPRKPAGQAAVLRALIFCPRGADEAVNLGHSVSRASTLLCTVALVRCLVKLKCPPKLHVDAAIGSPARRRVPPVSCCTGPKDGFPGIHRQIPSPHKLLHHRDQLMYPCRGGVFKFPIVHVGGEAPSKASLGCTPV